MIGASALRVGLALLVWLIVWEASVQGLNVNPFVLPAPSAILTALLENWPNLWPALQMTVKITWIALGLALISGALLAWVMHQNAWARASVEPLIVVLQVTPIVAIAPLVLVWSGVDAPLRALIVLAWIVALFPMLSSLQSALKSIDPGLLDLFRLSKATAWQRFWLLEVPACLPALLSGAKIAAGLALIGAIVGEFAAGSGQSQGLAWRLLEAQYRLEVPAMFACLFLLAAVGVAHHAALTWLEHRVLKRRGFNRD
jgi:NitT/TauT family transport system permease protein